MAGFLKKWVLFFSFGLSFSLTPGASAFEVDDLEGYLPEAPVEPTPPPPPSPQALHARMRKFRLALHTLGIPEEAAPTFTDFPGSGAVVSEEVASRLSFFDPDAGLRRYLSLGSEHLSLSRDLITSYFRFLGAVDFSLPLLPSGTSRDSEPLLERLHQIGAQVTDSWRSAPLKGLRIVLDPGHMGTPEWDKVTGKFVRHRGRKVSEGEITLWTAYLVASELEALGAEVHLTRDEPGTVATTAPFSFDPAPHIAQTFYNSIDSWMAPLFELGDSAFLSRVKAAPETKKAFSEAQKMQYFIGGEDLEARARLVDRIRPDIVINIHFDASQSDRIQSENNTIEAFVPGGIRRNETGSRIFRSQHLKHLLEVRRWNESVSLAGEMISEMSDRLGLPLLAKPEAFTGIRVRDGVYARNLYLNRRNLSALEVYLECLHYDHVDEFERMSQNTENGTWQGKAFQYPARLRDVSQGIRDGLLRYFRKLAQTGRE